MISWRTCLIVIAWSQQGDACSYRIGRPEEQVAATATYLANEYCSLSHIDLDPIQFLVQTHPGTSPSTPYPSKQYCGSFQNSWSAVNSSIVLASIGQRSSWVITSARVMRDCIKLPNIMMGPGKNPAVNRQAQTIYNNDGTTTYYSAMEATELKQWKMYYNLCWQSCSYRSGGVFVTKEPPSTFEFMFLPFHGPVSAREMMANRAAASGFAEFAPTFMLLNVVNYNTVKTVLDSSFDNSEDVLLFSRNTLMMTSFLEFDSVFLRKFVFPDKDDLTEHQSNFWNEVSGCLSINVANCPVLACGDNQVMIEDIMQSFVELKLVEGTLDGEKNEGCSNPYISGYIKGDNTTESGEELLSEAVSLQLLDAVTFNILSTPPIVGPFEDLISAVCPHAWFAHPDYSDGISTWASLISAMDPHPDNWSEQNDGNGDISTDVDDWTEISASDRCQSEELDIFSNRFMLPTPSAYQYGANVMYLPSEIEVYMYKMFEAYVADYKCINKFDEDCRENWSSLSGVSRTSALLRMKLRYRGHGAEHHAMTDINNFNSRVLSAEDCGGDLSETSFDIANGVSKYPASSQEPCVYMNYLLMITAACAEARGKSSSEKMCQEAIAAVLEMLRQVCENTCSSTIMADYFCTSVNSLSGGSQCSNVDVLYYYMSASSTSCDPYYQEFFPEFCNDDQFGQLIASTDDSITDLYQNNEGWGGETYYDIATASLYNCRRLASEDSRRLSHLCDRRLSHDIASLGFFRDSNALDNLQPVTDWITANSIVQGQAATSFMSFPDVFSSPGGIDFTTSEYRDYALDLLVSTQHWLVDETLPQGKTATHAGRVSVISLGIKDALLNDKDGEHVYAQIRDFFGEFLFRTAQAWESYDSNSLSETLDKVPVFATCDPEFEESLVRDAITLESARGLVEPGVEAGHGGSCAWPPAQLTGAIIERLMRGRFAKHRARYFW